MMIMDEIKRIPLKAFDKEYSTEWLREVDYLAEKGIEHVYEKKTDFGVRQFKYTKTPELFEALKEFYTIVEKERANIVSIDEAQEALKGSGISIRRNKYGKIEFVKDDE